MLCSFPYRQLLVFLQPFFAVPAGQNDQMQFFGTSPLASFLKPDTPSVFLHVVNYSQWSLADEMHET